jgi:hypothetical protein
LEEFEPAFNPPKEIDDPEDKKPSDWVDDAEYDIIITSYYFLQFILLYMVHVSIFEI